MNAPKFDEADQRLVNELAEKLVKEEIELEALPISAQTNMRRETLAADITRLKHMLKVFEDKLDLKPALTLDGIRLSKKLFREANE